MNRGLILKTLRETWLLTLILTLTLLGLEALLGFILANFHSQFVGDWIDVPFIRNMFQGLLGAEIGSVASPAVMCSTAWVHPAVLALVWAQVIAFCTRLPAGEVDRGTVDVLLGLPVSRWRVYLCEAAVWLGYGVALVGAGLAGFALSALSLAPERRPPWLDSVGASVNLYCLYLAVGGLAFLVSSLSDRRGRAVAVALAIVVAGFILNFAAQLWGPAKPYAFLSLMHYYRPFVILRDGAWPTADLLTLTGFGAACWLAGGIIFNRRDICTV